MRAPWEDYTQQDIPEHEIRYRKRPGADAEVFAAFCSEFASPAINTVLQARPIRALPIGRSRISLKETHRQGTWMNRALARLTIECELSNEQATAESPGPPTPPCG